MDISCGAAGVNIPVREDFSAVALVAGFFFPSGRIFQKSSMEDDTKSKEKVIVSCGGIKFFEKNSKMVLQNRGVILIISGVEKIF